MNKEDYVSLEVAKLLKEKGFNELCETEVNIYLGTWAYCDYDHVGVRNSNLPTNKASYPTLYEAAKWLRKNHNIYIDIGPFENEPYERITTWTYDIYDISTIENKCVKVGNENFKLYEDCFNKAIYEALKLI